MGLMLHPLSPSSGLPLSKGHQAEGSAEQRSHTGKDKNPTL